MGTSMSAVSPLLNARLSSMKSPCTMSPDTLMPWPSPRLTRLIGGTSTGSNGATSMVEFEPKPSASNEIVSSGALFDSDAMNVPEPSSLGHDHGVQHVDHAVLVVGAVARRVLAVGGVVEATRREGGDGEHERPDGGGELAAREPTVHGSQAFVVDRGACDSLMVLGGLSATPRS